MTGLLPFLKQTWRQLLALPAPRTSTTAAAASSLSPITKSPIFVLGNQSADLDSIISAILYSYFFSRAGNRAHVPLVNLLDVPSGTELRRLRPEFACAFELATSSRAETAHYPSGKDDGDGAVRLLHEHIVTVADLREQLLSSWQSDNNTKLELDAVLVDWNKPPHVETKKTPRTRGRGSVEGLHDLATFSVIGCIDHHADEDFVPPAEDLPDDNPRIIELGPGSCTSLIIREVQRRRLWPSQRPGASSTSPEQGDINVEIAKLALAAILIDTGNLTAEGKVTDVDRDAVSFLSQKISEARESGSSAATTWNQKAFFDEVQDAKAHSLDWLTVDEILGRDYKDWTESTASGEKVTIGIASIVRPLSWIISKANEEDGLRTREGLRPMLDKLRQFAQRKGLDAVSVMTAFTSDEGQFERELLVWGLHDGCIKQLENFAETSRGELGLEQWSQFPFDGCREIGTLYIWRQLSVRNSRKQVAPLLRKVYTGSRSTYI
ncbi:hypothetical protein PISL3812_04424 [Talaromyces islandicus]|uniref:DHHA2 domain-containing protein n=1 Tax=Talaromyces islandicus TaxID=28573 RepID=A0A0U1LVH4_TALIS|nr:hypothetical protein PISL3812_04424 [Talaromyces islandicus]